MKALRTIALLARMPGFYVLRDALLDNPLIDLDTVFTHGRLPKAEGGGSRPELKIYRETCADAGVQLQILDYPEARNLEEYLPLDKIDLLFVLSWRFILSPTALDRARVAAINLHRGALPEYGGPEPVRRAIEAGEQRVAITAHRMVEEIDSGPILASVWADINSPPLGQSNAEYAEAVKARLYPLYAPLAQLAIAAVVA